MIRIIEAVEYVHAMPVREYRMKRSGNASLCSGVDEFISVAQRPL
ncbi:hypothetical protein [Runella aurantiaca]|nr:hypothetical protein [Runella aurantiaca]